ncbi:652_t:CDS:2 [Entrophospora sp. SA101]|nr:652_t:CDS:2 [Entrophospora sp. SA101]
MQFFEDAKIDLENQLREVFLSEAQKQITIGHDLEANLTIKHPSVASIQCILTIVKKNRQNALCQGIRFETVVKNGWNRRTYVNDKQLKWNEEKILNNNDI